MQVGVGCGCKCKDTQCQRRIYEKTGGGRGVLLSRGGLTLKLAVSAMWSDGKCGFGKPTTFSRYILSISPTTEFNTKVPGAYHT